MRRVVWIYAMAGLSWALAFLLPFSSVPDDRVPQPEDDSAAFHSQLRPITMLRYGNSVLDVQARLNRGHLNPEQDGALYLDLEIRGLGDPTGGKLTTLLLIDRSGSMAGDKIQAARQSAERLLYQLADGDRIGIVSYGSDVNVDLPLTTIDPLSRSVARRTLARIEEGGGTHLEGGLAAAFRMLAAEDLRGRIGRVLLISDGRPTEGSRESARYQKWADDFRSLGVSLCTIGVGRDYDADLLATLAERSGGRFHDLRDASRLSRVLQDEIRHANHIVAHQVSLRLPEPLRAWAHPALFRKSSAQQNEANGIWVGDIAAGETRHILLRVEIPASLRTTRAAVSFSAPELVYRRPARQVEESLSHPNAAFLLTPSPGFSFEQDSGQRAVEAQVTKMMYSERLLEAMRQIERGEVQQAVGTLEKQAKQLDTRAQQTESALLRRESASLRRVLDSLGADGDTGKLLPDLTKHQRAHAMELRR